MFMIVPTGRGEEIMSELISKEDYEEILEWHYQQEKSEDEILMRPTCAPHYYRIVPQMAKAEGVDFERRSLTFSTGGGKGCIAAQTICLIDCFGNLKPCSYFHSSVGNVKQVPFRELWFNSKVFNDLRDFKQYKGKCGECEFINVCGGCRARADAVYGDYMAGGALLQLSAAAHPQADGEGSGGERPNDCSGRLVGPAHVNAWVPTQNRPYHSNSSTGGIISCPPNIPFSRPAGATRPNSLLSG